MTESSQNGGTSAGKPTGPCLARYDDDPTTYVCTLDGGHGGDHEAHDVADRGLLAMWDQGSAWLAPRARDGARPSSCPSWCVRDHNNEQYAEDVDHHASAITMLDATDEDLDRIGVRVHVTNGIVDGSGGPFLAVVGENGSWKLGVQIEGVEGLATAMVAAAARFGGAGA